MYAIRKIAGQLVSDDRLRRQIDSMKQQLYSQQAPG
jgi:hypothetical protein